MGKAFSILCVGILWILAHQTSEGKGPRKCPLIEIENGKAKIKSRGRVAKFKCRRGYTMFEGDKFATCVKGKWNGKIPKCITTGCDYYHSIPNGETVYLYNDALVQFICDPGYVLEGSSSLTCDGFGWNDTIPECQVPSNVEYSCDFETDSICGWSNGEHEEFDWTRNRGSSAGFGAGTGPLADHTLTTALGHYMYIDSSISGGSGDRARLYSPVYPPSVTESPSCFAFYYHMLGNTSGQLNIYMKGDKDDIDFMAPIYQMSGFNKEKWMLQIVHLHQLDTNFQIVMEATRHYHMSDIAIDDVKIAQGDECDKLEEESLKEYNTVAPDTTPEPESATEVTHNEDLTTETMSHTTSSAKTAELSSVTRATINTTSIMLSNTTQRYSTDGDSSPDSQTSVTLLFESSPTPESGPSLESSPNPDSTTTLESSSSPESILIIKESSSTTVANFDLESSSTTVANLDLESSSTILADLDLDSSSTTEANIDFESTSAAEISLTSQSALLLVSSPVPESTTTQESSRISQETSTPKPTYDLGSDEDLSSCQNRCGEIAMDTAHCGCDIECSDNHSCCLDVEEFCDGYIQKFFSSTHGPVTTLTSSKTNSFFQSTIEAATSSIEQQSSTITASPSVILLVSQTPDMTTTLIGSSTSKSPLEESTVGNKISSQTQLSEEWTSPKVSTFASTTMSAVTTNEPITKTTEATTLATESTTEEITEIDLSSTKSVEMFTSSIELSTVETTTLEFNDIITNSVDSVTTLTTSQGTHAAIYAIVIPIILIVIIITVLVVAYIRKKRRDKLPEDSDIQFLARDEIMMDGNIFNLSATISQARNSAI